MIRWIRRLRCSWSGHPLTERVMEFVERSSVIKTGPSWVPVSAELIADFPPLSFDYSLRCRCGKAVDPTVRSLFDGLWFGGAA